MRATNRTPREHYNDLLRKAWSKDEVRGPLGIPGWRRVSQATMRYLIEQGKVKATEQNKARAGIGVKASLSKKLRKLQKENEILQAIGLG